MRRIERNDIGIDFEIVSVSKIGSFVELNGSSERKLLGKHVARFVGSRVRTSRVEKNCFREGKPQRFSRVETRERRRGVEEREREKERERRGGGERRVEGLEREGERTKGGSEAFRFRSANSFHLMRSEEALDQS